MTLPKYAAKRDANETEIIKALELTGASVLPISMRGVPDLLVYRRGRHYLIEVKSEKGGLTKDQVEFHDTWKGPIHIVRNVKEALNILLVENNC